LESSAPHPSSPRLFHSQSDCHSGSGLFPTAGSAFFVSWRDGEPNNSPLARSIFAGILKIYGFAEFFRSKGSQVSHVVEQFWG
jgi:hypothetical protein